MTDFTKLSPDELTRVTTRDGRKVRILCVDGPSDGPVVGIFDGVVGAWRENGVYSSFPGSNTDLILPPALCWRGNEHGL